MTDVTFDEAMALVVAMTADTPNVVGAVKSIALQFAQHPGQVDVCCDGCGLQFDGDIIDAAGDLIPAVAESLDSNGGPDLVFCPWCVLNQQDKGTSND